MDHITVCFMFDLAYIMPALVQLNLCELTRFPWQSLVKLEGWEDIVTIISCDMRHWDAPQKADILVFDFFYVTNLMHLQMQVTPCWFACICIICVLGQWVAWFIWWQWAVAWVPWWCPKVFKARRDFNTIIVCIFFPFWLN